MHIPVRNRKYMGKHFEGVFTSGATGFKLYRNYDGFGFLIAFKGSQKVENITEAVKEDGKAFSEYKLLDAFVDAGKTNQFVERDYGEGISDFKKVRELFERYIIHKKLNWEVKI